jgi:hypothetical protein
MLSSAMTLRTVRDLALLGLAGALIGGIWLGEASGTSFLLACLWAASNLALLSLFISTMIAQKTPARLLVFILVCAKIPASYLILYWLLSADFTDMTGLVAGLVAFPAVLIVRGLLDRPTDPIVEEGR